MRAQASIELLIVLAALLAFLLAFLPFVMKTRELASNAIIVKQEQIALEKISSAAREALVLGKENSFVEEVFFPVSTIIYFENNSLAIEFNSATGAKKLVKKTFFESRTRESLEAGNYLVRIANKGLIELSFFKQQQ